jgi:hypothetical protein
MAEQHFLGVFDTRHTRRKSRVIFSTMEGATGERWKQLCEQAAVEQDPDKLIALTQEINRLLTDKEERLKNLRLKPDLQKP